MSTAQPPEGLGRGTQRWPRRRVLRWALGLLPAGIGGGWAAFEWLGRRRARAVLEADQEAWARPYTQAVALACFSGRPDAQAGVEGLLQAFTPSRPARLLGACLSLERGDWSRARWHLNDPRMRGTPEARLLVALAERRPHSSEWCQAFLEVWKALGRPDFSESTLLPQPLEWNLLLADTEAVWASATEAQRFSLGVLNTVSAEPRQDWMLEQVRSSPSVSLLMALREQLLALDARAPLLQRLLPAVEARLGQLAGPSPRTLQLALVSFLANGSMVVPFERRELETLEKLVTLPEWMQPASYEEFFLEMRALFDGLLLAPSHHAWAMASLSQGVSLGTWLVQRARASKAHLSEDEQRWMGRLLWEVGARLGEQRSDRALDMGLRLQMFGSELTQHVPTREACIALWVELGRWEEALKQSAYSRWPLASLQEASCEPRARDERSWMKAFAGLGELP